jgi:hypothetical protein
MKIAYLILLHHKLEQFRYLLDAIYSTHDMFLIHIDRGSPSVFHRAVQACVGGFSNVGFLSSRPVAWGGWSVIAPELRAIEFFLKASRDWSYYINLSGQDYPIKPREVIRDTLKAAWPRNFVEVETFAEKRAYQPDDPHLKRRLTFDLFGIRRLVTPIPLPAPKLIDMDFKGSHWHMLSREFCDWMVDAPIRRHVERYLRFTSCPSEVFIQTMIMNSPFAEDRMGHSGREVIWPGPKVLDSGDYDRLMRSPALFARKFDQTKDPDILLRLAKSNGYIVPSPVEAIPS